MLFLKWHFVSEIICCFQHYILFLTWNNMLFLKGHTVSDITSYFYLSSLTAVSESDMLFLTYHAAPENIVSGIRCCFWDDFLFLTVTHFNMAFIQRVHTYYASHILLNISASSVHNQFKLYRHKHKVHKKTFWKYDCIFYRSTLGMQKSWLNWLWNDEAETFNE
jgi:hypothetical protein